MLVDVFFKQKTAYEMRISDWSSDVCSSDLRNRRIDDRLRNPAAAVERVLVQPLLGPDAIARGRPCGQIQIKRIGVTGMAEDRMIAVGCRLRIAIGRASCRERVCQSV